MQAQTIACDFQKVFKMGETLMMGLPGLAADVLTVSQKLKFRTSDAKSICFAYNN